MEYGFTQGANDDDEEMEKIETEDRFVFNATQFEPEEDDENPSFDVPDQNESALMTSGHYSENFLDDEGEGLVDLQTVENEHHNDQGENEAEGSISEEEEEVVNMQISQTYVEEGEEQVNNIYIAENFESSQANDDPCDSEEPERNEAPHHTENSSQSSELKKSIHNDHNDLAEVSEQEDEEGSINLIVTQTQNNFFEEVAASQNSHQSIPHNDDSSLIRNHTVVIDVDLDDQDGSLPDDLSQRDRVDSDAANITFQNQTTVHPPVAPPVAIEENEDEDVQAETEEMLDQHISQTPAEPMEIEEEDHLMDEHVEDVIVEDANRSLQKQEENNDIEENRMEEEEEEEINLHITQTQLPLTIPEARPQSNRMTDNARLQQLNATYISPMKSHPLAVVDQEEEEEDRDEEEANEGAVNLDDQLKCQRGPEAGEEKAASNEEGREDQEKEEGEEEEEDLNLCITPSQRKDSFLIPSLPQEITPIVPTKSTHPSEVQKSLTNELEEVDAFQLMLQPAKAETSNYSIYEFLQGTPNQLSGLSIIRNRGDVSMYSSSSHQALDATQLDHLPSSQTFLSKRSTSSTAEQQDDPLPTVVEMDEEEEEEEKKQAVEVEVINIEPKEKNRASEGTMSNQEEGKEEVARRDSASVIILESQEWLQATERIPSKQQPQTKITVPDTTQSSTGDMHHLKVLYEQKLKELEALKKVLEEAEVPVNPPTETVAVPSSQLGTEEYAKILTSLAHPADPNQEAPVQPSTTPTVLHNKTKESKSTKAVTIRSKTPEIAAGWDDDSGPLISVPVVPQRKFNTFAKIASPASATKPPTTTAAEAMSSTEKSITKMRRRYGGGSGGAAGTPLALSKEDFSPEKRKIQFEFDLTEEGEGEEEEEKEQEEKERDAKQQMDHLEKSEEEKNSSSKTSEKISRIESPELTSRKNISQKSSHSHSSLSSEKKKPSAEKVSEITKTIAMTTEDYLPASFKEGPLPLHWANVWAVLEKVGWYWAKGKGLIDFYYIRPGAKPQTPYRLNEDYFTSPDDVMAYIHQKCPAIKETTASSTTYAKKSLKVMEGTPRLRRLSKSKKEKEIEEEGDGDEEFSVSLASEEKRNHSHNNQKSKQTRGVTAPNDSASSSSDTEQEGEEARYDLRTLPWKDLWKILRSYGWSWDFGPNVLQYYYVPRYDFKRDKEAILGVHKFTTEEEVRRYLKKEYRKRLDDSSDGRVQGDAERGEDDGEEGDYEEMWSLFYLSSSSHHHSQSASTQESQYLDDYLREDWTLAKNRRKRHRESLDQVPSKRETEKDRGNKGSKEREIHKKQKVEKTVATASSSHKTAKIVSQENTKRRDSVKRASGPSPSSSSSVTSTSPEKTGKEKKEYEDGEDINTQMPTLSPERFPPPAVASTSRSKKNKTSLNSIPSASASHSSATATATVTTVTTTEKGTTSSDKKKSPASVSAAITASMASLPPKNSHLFQNLSFLFSGIAETVRERCEVLIKQHAGAILNEVPKETNYYELYQHHLQLHHQKALTNSYRFSTMTVLISQAKDFRKPKFITATILGLPIVSMDYLFDCLSQQRLLPFERYYLPITYSAIHSYHLFRKPPVFDYSPEEESSQKGLGSGSSGSKTNKHSHTKKETKKASGIGLPYIFRFPDRDQVDEEEDSSNKKRKHFSNEEEEDVAEEVEDFQGLFQGLRVLNLTGMKIWEEILTLCRCALFPRQDKTLLKALLATSTFTAADGANFPVDVIIFDPITYTKSLIFHKKQQQQQSPPQTSDYLQKHHLLSEQEIKVLQHCHQVMQTLAVEKTKGGNSNKRKNRQQADLQVVSIDWITHRIALQEKIDLHCLDLFQLPSDPIHYPLAVKFDQDFYPSTANAATTSTTTVNNGERYSKYDLVYFQTSTSSNAVTSVEMSRTVPNTSSLAIGKILSFSRRNETAIPFVKIQLLDAVATAAPSSSSHHQATAVKVLTPKKYTAEMIISMSQLAGKVIVLHRKEYYQRICAPTGSSSSSFTTSSRATTELKLQLLLSAKELEGKKAAAASQKKEQEKLQTMLQEEEMYCTSLDYEHQYSIIPYQVKSADDEEEEEEASEGDQEEDDEDENDGREMRKKRPRFLLSQDI